MHNWLFTFIRDLCNEYYGHLEMMGYRQTVMAQDFDSCIPGSNPGSLIGYMLTFHVTTYVFHMYLNPWLSDSSIWVPPFATRTILLRAVRDRPVVFYHAPIPRCMIV